jgi:hypothetical protein
LVMKVGNPLDTSEDLLWMLLTLAKWDTCN